MGIKKINVLVLGSGAREHALALKISQSRFLKKLYLADANDGFLSLGENIEFSNYENLAKTAKEKEIDLLVVGAEKPLCDGVCDIFLSYGIKTIGVDKKFSRLEGSKIFAKKFIEKNSIKTANYFVVENEKELEAALVNFENPPVIKADGLAGGKGVYIADSFFECEKIAKEFLKGKFGEASKKILLEERLFGREISIFSLFDGKNLLSFPPASDFKKLENGDLGKNTGGMGASFPSKLSENENILLEEYLKKLKVALIKEGANFSGIIYSGLILTEGGLYVLEYNVRFGDPEIQCVLEALKTDILEIFIKMTEKKLDNVELEFKNEPSFCIVLAAFGYPDSPKVGYKINGLECAPENKVSVFYSGVKFSDGELYSASGRVLSLCKCSKNALFDIYETANNINFENKIYRSDVCLK